jgi:hypothetical protein
MPQEVIAKIESIKDHCTSTRSSLTRGTAKEPDKIEKPWLRRTAKSQEEITRLSQQRVF